MSAPMLGRCLVLGWLLSGWPCGLASAAGDGLADEAAQALRKATEFFRTQVATEGGYLWRYSDDLARREGEGKASATTVWVQPPGTPSVGLALLEAYRDTGDGYYLDAARQAGQCLVRGQLRSGGWDYRIVFDPAERRRYDYRVDPATPKMKRRNVSTLDDNTTQAAIRLLIHLDQALDFGDQTIHEAAQYALGALLEAQYPNGAWPQRFEGPPDAARFPIKNARFPESWSRTYPQPTYSGFYTLNDNVILDTVEVLFEASRVYGQERYVRAAARAGDFLLLAQLPEPQPAWAQQYDAEMQPAWARKFEPPSVTGGESQGAMRALLRIYQETGEKKYLEPIPRAIAYLRRSQLPDGRLARFYELKTNRPLYFTRDYQLTYDDGDLPTHYAFQVPHDLDAIERQYQRLAAASPESLKKRGARPAPARPTPHLIEQVKEVVASLDAQGRWVDEGRLKYHGPDDPTRRVIDCQTFIRNVHTLSAYLAAVRRSKPEAPARER